MEYAPVLKSITINAKEKQLAFIKNSLKPLLKAEGYKTAGIRWWKFNEPYFNLIQLQNFSWNLQSSVDFCFNFTTGLTGEIKNLNKPTMHDGIPHIRESYFKVKMNDYWKGSNAYHINDHTDLDKFTGQVLNDFKLLILPKFDSLKNKDVIIQFYSDDFWAPIVKQRLAH